MSNNVELLNEAPKRVPSFREKGYKNVAIGEEIHRKTRLHAAMQGVPIGRLVEQALEKHLADLPRVEVA